MYFDFCLAFRFFASIFGAHVEESRQRVGGERGFVSTRVLGTRETGMEDTASVPPLQIVGKGAKLMAAEGTEAKVDSLYFIFYRFCLRCELTFISTSLKF